MHSSLSADIVHEHIESLKKWYAILQQVMPPYFFKNVDDAALCDILPLLFDIDKKSGIQMIESQDKFIFAYLKDDHSSPVVTSQSMAGHRVVQAVVHESKPLPELGKSLVIEQITKWNALSQEDKPAFTLESLRKAYKNMFGKVPREFNELYERLNWHEIRDLDESRLVTRLNLVLQVQSENHSVVTIEKVVGGYRITTACPMITRQEGYFGRTIELLKSSDFEVQRSYLRVFSHDGPSDNFETKGVLVNTYYATPSTAGARSSNAIKKLERSLNELCWSAQYDLFERELLMRHGFCFASLNLIRAAATFVHTQLAFVDRNAYSMREIERFMVTYPDILRQCVKYFELKFDPQRPAAAAKLEGIFHRVLRAIEQINSGIPDKDHHVRTVLFAVADFLMRIQKSNYYCENKSALSFRLDPVFMDFYEKLSDQYSNSFPKERPYGVFYFYHGAIFGFHIRFAEFARGGWRTVVPRAGENEFEDNDSLDFERSELFRECYRLAHTQHRKNKDIFEGGAKMVTLLTVTQGEFKPQLWAGQRAIFDAFLQLILCDRHGNLRDDRIKDFYGRREMIEIGPDENMFDEMIVWMGDRAERAGYVLGSGIISGKPEGGINHKHYGVTSFGVHQYLLHTLRYLGIDPEKGDFSVKISGGPNGDVAGNELKLLNAKDEFGRYLYPNLKIVAVTDGPAALYDPSGIDREELSRLIHSSNLDVFDPAKLSGEGAAMLLNKPIYSESGDLYRILRIEQGKLQDKKVSRDEFMCLFQTNICHGADVFIPCGGRPSTINIKNYKSFVPDGRPSARAIIEGANSYITPEARIALQQNGIVIVKDASANKCGVITSSYEILAGLMLDKSELKNVREKLVVQVMEKLKSAATREAQWLYRQFDRGGKFLTELSDELTLKLDALHVEISHFLDNHREYITEDLIFEHLPPLFKKDFPDRLLRIPAEYRKEIAAVELALRIVYAEQIKGSGPNGTLDEFGRSGSGNLLLL